MNDYKNQIINGNCVKVMGKFPANFIDLTVTSPRMTIYGHTKGILSLLKK